MFRFPFEDAISSELQEKLRDEFNLADRVLYFWTSRPFKRYFDNSKLCKEQTLATILLNASALRHFRSIVGLCERGEAVDAMVLTRTLLETLFALRFVLTPTIRIKLIRQPSSGANVRYMASLLTKAERKTGKHRLSPKLRALLYLYFTASQDEDFVRSRSQGVGLTKKFALGVARALDPTVMATFEKLVGKEWVGAQKQRHSYSGLSVDALSQVLGKPWNHMYQTVYHFYSRLTHSSEAIRGAIFTDAGEIHPEYVSDVDSVKGALRIAVGIYLMFLVTMHRAMDLGTTVESLLYGIKQELNRMDRKR